MTATSAATLISIPTIETERTILRAHRRDDFDAYAAMWADPRVTRYIGDPRSRQESWTRFLRHAGTWMMTGHGYWAVADKTTGAFIGETGFQQMMRDMKPSIDGIPEIGWALSPSVHGLGLGTEIARAAVEWGDETWGKRKTVCIVDPKHVVSLRIATKLGYGNTVDADFDGEPVLLLSRISAGVAGMD